MLLLRQALLALGDAHRPTALLAASLLARAANAASLAHNGIGDADVPPIAAALTTRGCRLTSLDLQGHEITREGGAALGVALRSNSSLVDLLLDSEVPPPTNCTLIAC